MKANFAKPSEHLKCKHNIQTENLTCDIRLMKEMLSRAGIESAAPRVLVGHDRPLYHRVNHAGNVANFASEC